MAEAPPARVLVVDDDESVSITMRAVLEQEGYAVEAARSAAEARVALEHASFDAALLDLHLDDADGIEVLSEVGRRQPECSAVMLTGYGSLDSAIRAIRGGAYDYLLKPCALDELKLTIGRAVERSRLRRALAARIADLEAANATIAAFNQDLQGKIDAATAELQRTVEDLRRTQHHLQESQRQRFEFVSMIAHELGQPLTTIVGYAQLLSRPDQTEERVRQALDVIVGESRRLTRLVQDLSDVARLTTGRFQVHTEPADLAEIAAAQVTLAQERSPDHRIVYAGRDQPLPLEFDPDRVAQIVANLIGNAIKYTPGGTITVRVGLADQAAELSVTDEGPGIPPDRLDEIFEPHVRLVPDESGSTPRGAGLGLYIARGIAEAHGGRLFAENVPGGARVTLLLPLQGHENQGKERNEA
ncbi:MAG TPA: hybrid sensor histidine kinase/response regulator [Dehalococcoidia bacterium]|nr:hybrid sensor histidine kinase/response regulator [Dehalococcoidia bacterium]